ncbi:MAG: restriction endonuclease subunit S, partial [Christensenellaceae bacterium]
MSKVRLRDCADVLNGYAFKSTKYVKNGFSVIRITNVQKGKVLNDDPKFYCQDDSLNKYQLFENDILISLTGNVGRVGRISRDLLPAYLNQRVGCIRIKDASILDSGYLFNYLNSDFFENLCIENANGVAQKNLSTEWLKDIFVFTPKIEIQQQIANVLETTTTLISKRKEQIALLDKLAKDVFIDMFGDPVSNPMGWENVALEKLQSFLTSGSRGWAKHYSDEGEFFITIKNVRNGRLLKDNIQHVNAPNTKEAQRTRVQENDVLISITADLGRTAVIDAKTAQDGAFINQHLCLIRPLLSKVYPLYLSAYLESPAGHRQFIQKDQMGVKSGLNFDAIKSILVLLPDYELQKKYTLIVSDIDAQKSRLQTSLAELEITYKSILQ